MARKPKDDTSLVQYDEAFAKQAAAAAEQEASAATGQFLSLRGGVITFQGAVIPGNKIPVVILDGVLENQYYKDKFDPEEPSAPICYAFGRNDKEMKPHEKVSDPQNATCQGCKHNEWGTADRGRGKACRNTRRLALIPAGSFDSSGRFEANNDPDHYETAQPAFLRLPVTSVKGYAFYVKQIAESLKRPPHGVITKISVAPDPQHQFHVTFENLGMLPKASVPTILRRHDEMAKTIDFAYIPPEALAGGKPEKKKTKRQFAK